MLTNVSIMSVYNPADSQKLYEDYLREENESILTPLLKSVAGLIDSVIYKEFYRCNKHMQEELRQDANLLLIEIFRNKYIKLDGNYTSCLYACIKSNLIKRIKLYNPAIFVELEVMEFELPYDPISDTVKELTDKDSLLYLRSKIRRLYRELDKELQHLAKFVCFYYLAKKDFPPPELIKSKFKQTHMLDVYQKVRIQIKKKLFDYRIAYLKGED